MRNFHIRTWGCQMNACDSEKIENLLVGHGWKACSSMNDADAVILNTCSVRQRAEDKVFGLGKQIAEIKKARPATNVILTGCMTQRIKRVGCEEVYDDTYTKKMLRKMSWVDEIVPIGDLASLAKILEVAGKIPSYDESEQMHGSAFSAYVPISKGCNNFCTYCIVPYTRGKEVSLPRKQIIKNVASLVEQGYSLVTLLGQNVNSWSDPDDGALFPVLLDQVSDIPGEYWLTFLTSHPKDFTEELVKVLTKKKICKYLNLPVQSGSSSALKRMNRGYTREDYLEKVRKLRELVPDVRLSTDIIVGFPGETGAEFQETLSLLEEVQFGMVYVAEYSPRTPAASAMMKDSVLPEEKRSRRQNVEILQKKIMGNLNKTMIGKRIRVLITGKNTAHTFDMRDVRVDSFGKEVPGTFTDVEITDSSAAGLVGRVAV